MATGDESLDAATLKRRAAHQQCAALPSHIPASLAAGGKEHKGDGDLQESTFGIRARDGGGSRSPYVAVAETCEDSVQLLCRGLAGAGDNTPRRAVEMQKQPHLLASGGGVGKKSNRIQIASVDRSDSTKSVERPGCVAHVR